MNTILTQSQASSYVKDGAAVMRGKQLSLLSGIRLGRGTLRRRFHFKMAYGLWVLHIDPDMTFAEIIVAPTWQECWSIYVSAN